MMYLAKKKFKKKTYYYVVQNKIINKRPTMKHIMYLGSAEKILEIFKKFKRNKN